MLLANHLQLQQQPLPLESGVQLVFMLGKSYLVVIFELCIIDQIQRFFRYAGSTEYESDLPIHEKTDTF